MLCQLCQLNDANITLKHVLNGDVSALHVCETCAAAKGLGVNGHLLGELLLGQVDAESELSLPSTCPMCGLAVEALRSGGRVGCEQCYESFSSYLMPLVGRMQPGLVHVGRAPLRLQQRETLAELREELSEAVSLQAFERAAQLRDRIRELEGALLGEASL